MKVLFYGVRDVEVPLFHEQNKRFGFDLELIPDYLSREIGRASCRERV